MLVVVVGRERAALVVHRHARRRGGPPGSSSSPACRWSGRARTGWFAHPNYVAVVVEGAALPLVGSAWITAVHVHAWRTPSLLTVRIRCETRALPRPARAAVRAMIDVLVVGGGPAGLATAIQLRAGGLAVTVAEPRTAPIDKACGEGLMPAAVPRLAALGVAPGRARVAASATWTPSTA